MTNRDSKLPLALLLLFIGISGVYSSTGLFTPPASAAKSQDHQETTQGADDAQNAAAKFYLRKRLPEGEKEIPVERYLEAREQMRRMPRYSTARNQYLSAAEAETDPTANWTELGPGNIGGRTRALIIHPTNHDTMYAAAASGGVWKTTDGGAGWKPLADAIANIAVNALAIDRNDPNVIYVGTGEGFFNFDAIRGAGIFKSADGGATWSRLAATAPSDFYYVNDIIVSPDNGQRVYAATRAGVWRSVDGGANWTRTLDPAVTGGCLDLVIRSDQTTDYIFASCGTFTQAKIYRNADAGGAGAWTEVLSDPGMGRTSLALAPSNQNIVYAAAANPATNNQPGLHAIFRSTASGDPNTWTAQVRRTDVNKLNTVLFSWTRDAFYSECGLGPGRFFNTGWYANSIAVDPVDASRIWVGGVELFRSDDGGANWGLASYSWIDASAPQYAHTHHHAIAFHPQYNGASNKTLFVAGDGGIYKTGDAIAATATGTTAPCDPSKSAVRWSSLNRDYAATQLYHGAPYPDGTRYLAGANGHGFLRGSDGDGVNGWSQMLGGDGGFVAVDPADANVIYTAVSGGFIRKSSDGGRTFAAAHNGIADPGFVYIAPLAPDPSDGARLWTGGRSLWRTNDGASRWTPAGIPLQQGSYSAIAVAPSDSNFVLAGTSAGQIYRSANTLSDSRTSQWAFATPRSGYVSWIAFDPVNPNAVYATYSTFGGVHVWRSADGGATWKGIDGSETARLPDVPVHCLVVDPQNRDRLFIGTDVGIFVTTDGGATWAAESGVPNVVTEALALNTTPNAARIFAFTYGRGAHRAELGGADCRYSLSPASVTIKAEGGGGSVNISAPNGCPWTANVNASGEGWIRINGAGGGAGAGTINFTIEAKTSALARAGTINIAGRSFTVTQAGIVNPRPPTLKITSPTSAGNFSTDVSTIRLSGTAVSAAGVTQVIWRVDRGFINPAPFPTSGVATGAANWSIPAIILQPGVNLITVTAYDTTGASGGATINILYSTPSTIIPIAGNGDTQYNGDNRPALTASVTSVQSLVVDNAGTIYILDAGHGLIRKINLLTGIITKVAGGGVNGFAEGIPATDAWLEGPTAIALDAAGNIYVTSFEKSRVRKITTDGIIRTIAGSGEFGYSGDGGPAIQAKFRTPSDVKVDGAGNIYIADSNNNRVRKIDAATGIITTVAGGGTGGDGVPATMAQLSLPRQIAFDSKGNLFISDHFANTIRKVAAGGEIISTVAGVAGNAGFEGDGGPATAAKLRNPFSIAFDRADNLYIHDSENKRIRKINASDGIINTIAGGGVGSPIGVGSSVATNAGGALAFDNAGHLLIGGSVYIYKLVPFLLPDSIAPAISITAPTTQPAHTVDTAQNFRLEGAVSDNVGVVQIMWTNDRGGSGFANVTCCNYNAWSIFNLQLKVGLNNITVTAWDAAGNSGQASLAVTYNATSVSRTLAGIKTTGFSGDGGLGAAAQFWSPESVSLDASGNLFVADTGNHRIRKITRGGIVTTVAGNGMIGNSGNGGPATEASLNGPRGVAVDATGNLYIADTNNNRIRKVTPAGVITVIAGTGVAGFSGDGGAAINAQINTPYGVAVDAAGAVYFADLGNHRIRKINSAGNVITTVAGSGYGFGGDGGPAASAKLAYPRGVAVDAAGNLYLSDTDNARVRKITAAGVISTIAGNGQRGVGQNGIPATSSPLWGPSGITLDQSGNLYFADQSNHQIRKVGADGLINTVAGNPAGGSIPSDDEGAPATAALLLIPAGVAVDRAGNIYIADTGNQRIVIVTDYRNVTSVHAASFAGPSLSSESIAAAFGVNLAAATEAASTLPLPTTLGGSSIRVRDSEGRERSASLFFASPSQINYQIPPGTADGPATIIVANSEGVISTGLVRIEPTAPGLFSANADGQGVAAALALRIRADGSQSYEPAAVFDQAQKKFIALPLDFGAATDRLFLILFGAGLRQRASLSSVSARISDEPVEVLYAGAQGGFAGLDQINLSPPRALAGRGEVDVVITVDDKPANTVRVAFAGAACNYQVTSNSQIVPAAGGTFNAGVATGAGCYWSARSGVNWITPTLNGYANGNGTASFRIEPNASPLPRTGQIRIAGQNIAITQSGEGNLSPPSLTVNTPGGASVFTVSSPVVDLNGSATGAPSVAFVNWSNDRGGYGFASGANNWSIAAIPLQVGQNRLTITVYDSLGRSESSIITANFRPEFLIQTIAGAGDNDPADGLPAASIKLRNSLSVTFDNSDNLYVADERRILKISPSGIVTGVFNVPSARTAGLAFRNGFLYFTDLDEHVVRKIELATGVITRIAGVASFNFPGFSGDGGPATEARLNLPNDLALDATGNLYIADTSNHRIRKVTASTGIITTIAGNGANSGPLGDGGQATMARLTNPVGLAFDNNGNLVVLSDGRARRIDSSSGIISTIAGGGEEGLGDGGQATSAQIRANGLAFDGANNLVLADTGNYRVRRISAASGLITTIAGTGSIGVAGDGGPSVLAQLGGPFDVAFDSAGNIVICDQVRIRKLTPYPAPPAMQTGRASTDLNK